MARPLRWCGDYVCNGDIRRSGFGVMFHDTGDGFPARLIGTLVLLCIGTCCHVSVPEPGAYLAFVNPQYMRTIVGFGPMETSRLGLWLVLVSWYGFYVLRRTRLEREKRRIAEEQGSSRAREHLQARAQATLRIDRSEPSRELAAEQA